MLDDPLLVAEVRELGLVPELAAHPLPAPRDAGLIVTLNTDIPNVTGTTLTEEFRRARDVFGLDDTVLAELNHAAIDASFAPEATKERLRGCLRVRNEHA